MAGEEELMGRFEEILEYTHDTESPSLSYIMRRSLPMWSISASAQSHTPGKGTRISVECHDSCANGKE